MISIQLKRVFMFLINYLFVFSWGFIWAENCLNLLQKIITFLYHHFILSACLQTYKTTKMTFNIYNKNFTLLKLLFVFLKPHFNCCYCVIFENRPLRWVWLKGSDWTSFNFGVTCQLFYQSHGAFQNEKTTLNVII